MDDFDPQKARLSDRVLFALDLALEQNDLEIAEILNRALDLSMTRNTGGGEFIERRGYPQSVERALDRLRAMKRGKNSAAG